MAGLQDISPILRGSWVMRRVRAPRRAAAAAASQPAWPPPTTITSKFAIARKCATTEAVASASRGKAAPNRLFHVKRASLADAEITKNHVQEVFYIHAPYNPAQGPEREAQIFGKESGLRSSLGSR